MSQTFRTDIPITAGMRDSSYADVYANQIRMNMSLVDFTLVFGVTEDVGLNQIINKDKAAIRLSIPNVKALLLHLQAAVEAYENTVSKIPMSPAVEVNVRAMRGPIENALRQQMNPAATAPEDNGRAKKR